MTGPDCPTSARFALEGSAPDRRTQRKEEAGE